MDLKNLFSSITRSLSGGKINLGNLAGKVESKLQSKTKTFTFQALPASLADLKALPEASLSDPYATAALSLLALNPRQRLHTRAALHGQSLLHSLLVRQRELGHPVPAFGRIRLHQADKTAQKAQHRPVVYG